MRSLLILFLFILSGCKSDNIKLSQACESVGKVCQNLKVEGRCLSLRRDVIIGAFNLKEKYTEKNQYQHMLILEEYVDCAEKATWVEYRNLANIYAEKDAEYNHTPSEDELKKRKENIESQHKSKQDRIVSYEYSKKLLNDLDEASINNKDPYSLYWHWTRKGDKKAIAKLIELDKEGKINTYDMKYYLSQEYVKRDTDKAISYMLQSLSLYPKEHYQAKYAGKRKYNEPIVAEGNKYHFSIFRGLSSLYFKKKEYEKSYLFTRLLEMNNDDTANTQMIARYIKGKKTKLDKKAEKIHELMKVGQFKFMG